MRDANLALPPPKHTPPPLPASLSSFPPPPQVEEYMTDIIQKMRSELRSILQSSVSDYSNKERVKWQFDWPSQIILVVSSIFWCSEVEDVSVPTRCSARVCLRARAHTHFRMRTFTYSLSHTHFHVRTYLHTRKHAR